VLLQYLLRYDLLFDEELLSARQAARFAHHFLNLMLTTVQKTCARLPVSETCG
jgi:hypothetical protein